MSGDPEQEYFADAMTDEIIARLSKNSMLTVIARNSTFTYKSKAVKVQQVGQELGVTHVLEGSVRKSGNRVRIIAQLVDAATGGHLWSETYEREVKDIFTVQAEVAQQIAAALWVEYTEAELIRVRHIPTENLTAYDSFWRAYDHVNRGTEDDIAQAREYSERAVELDPSYADAYALLAWSYVWDYHQGYNRDPQVLAEISDLSKRALALGSSSIYAHITEAWYYLLKEQYESALAKTEKATSLDPNNPWSHWVAGISLLGMGRYEEATEKMTKTALLDPHYWIFVHGLGLCYSVTGQYEDAIAAFRKSQALSPAGNRSNYFCIAQNYAISWRTQQNRGPQVMTEALAIAAENPQEIHWNHIILSWIHFYRRQHDLATAEAEKGLAIQPESAEGHALLAEIHSFAGRPEKAMEIAEKAARLGPWALYGYSPWPYYAQGHAHRMLGDPAEAIGAYRECLSRRPAHGLAYRSRLGLTIAYAELGRIEEATAEADQILKLVPNFSVAVYGEREPYADPAQAERDMAALRKAGLK